MENKLDYSLETSEERIALINKIIENTPPEKLNPRLLNYFSNYILFTSDKSQTYKERHSDYSILTDNREATITKREQSYEELVGSLESGEDGLHALINNDKNQLLDRKDKVTKEEIEKYPQLKTMMDEIDKMTERLKTTSGKSRWFLKNQIIETGKQLYVLRASLKGGSGYSSHKTPANLVAKSTNIDERITVRNDGSLDIQSPLSLLVPEHISVLLCNYSKIKEDTYDDLNSDLRGLLIDLEDLVMRVYKDDPMMLDLIIGKIDGKSNEKIQDLMEVEYGEKHNAQYYSTVGRQRIPKTLAKAARKEGVYGHFSNEAYGEWKHCNKCDQGKPANPLFFGKNSTKSGYYSVCNDCRNKK